MSTLDGFHAAFFTLHRRFPSKQEIFDEGVREGKSRATPADHISQARDAVTREIWMAEVCQDEDGFKHIEAVVEDLDDFAAGTRLYAEDGRNGNEPIDEDHIAKLAHEVSTECLAVPGVNFYMAAEMAIERTLEMLGLKSAPPEKPAGDVSDI